MVSAWRMKGAYQAHTRGAAKHAEHTETHLQEIVQLTLGAAV